MGRGVRKKKRRRKEDRKVNMMYRKRIITHKRRSEEQRGGVAERGKIKKEEGRDRKKVGRGGDEKQRD